MKVCLNIPEEEQPTEETCHSCQVLGACGAEPGEAASAEKITCQILIYRLSVVNNLAEWFKNCIHGVLPVAFHINNKLFFPYTSNSLPRKK